TIQKTLYTFTSSRLLGVFCYRANSLHFTSVSLICPVLPSPGITNFRSVKNSGSFCLVPCSNRQAHLVLFPKTMMHETSICTTQKDKYIDSRIPLTANGCIRGVKRTHECNWKINTI